MVALTRMLAQVRAEAAEKNAAAANPAPPASTTPTACLPPNSLRNLLETTAPPPTLGKNWARRTSTAGLTTSCEVVENVYYVPDWISEEAANALEAELPDSSSTAWAKLPNRRLLNCGGVPHPSGMFGETLPPWFDAICERLDGCGAFAAGKDGPNHVLLNEYTVSTRQSLTTTSTAPSTLPTGKRAVVASAAASKIEDEPSESNGCGGSDGCGGGIAPHKDGPLFDSRVAILTLGGPAIFHFWDSCAGNEIKDATNGWAAVAGKSPVCSFLLEPRSLLVFEKEAYTDFLHGIRPVARETIGPTVCNLAACKTGLWNCGDVVERGARRLSLTVRRVRHVAKESGAFLTREEQAECARRWAWWRGAISDR